MSEENLISKKPSSYSDYLKQDLGSIIDDLELSDMQKRFLRSRWLDQVLWMEGRAGYNQKRYYILRLVTIIGGVIVPVLVSLESPFFRYAAIFLSLIVAISAAVEEFFHYGERWKHYRQTVETLKVEGWKFFQLSGAYKDYVKHSDAYSNFADRVEEIIQRDVEMFVTEVVKEKENGEE